MAILVLVGAALLFFPITSAQAQAVDQESRLTQLLNAARASYGLAPLSTASDLTAMARQHAAEMAAAGDIWHQSLSSIDGARVGENVGLGSSADQVHAAFMDSATHRSNIVGPYSEVGIGVVISNGTLYVDELFREPWPASDAPPATEPAPQEVAPAPEPGAPVTAAAAPEPASTTSIAPEPASAAAPAVSDATAISAVSAMALPLMFVAATPDNADLTAASVMPAVSVRTAKPVTSPNTAPLALVAGALIVSLLGSQVRVLLARR